MADGRYKVTTEAPQRDAGLNALQDLLAQAASSAPATAAVDFASLLGNLLQYSAQGLTEDLPALLGEQNPVIQQAGQEAVQAQALAQLMQQAASQGGSPTYTARGDNVFVSEGGRTRPFEMSGGSFSRTNAPIFDAEGRPAQKIKSRAALLQQAAAEANQPISLAQAEAAATRELDPQPSQEEATIAALLARAALFQAQADKADQVDASQPSGYDIYQKMFYSGLNPQTRRPR